MMEQSKEDPTADVNEDLNIEVVSTVRDATSAVHKLISEKQGQCKAFGLDCEWNVVHAKGAPQKPDLLQIASSDGFCVLFRLSRLSTIPPELKAFLEDPGILKVGVAIIDDAKRLEDYFGVTTKGVIDIRYVADAEGEDPRGLSTLTHSILGESCMKQNWRFHRWTGFLSDKQKRYAAMDALYGVKIFELLNLRRVCRKWGTAWKSWSKEEYSRCTARMWEEYFHRPFQYDKSKYVIGKLVDDILRLSDLRTKMVD